MDSVANVTPTPPNFNVGEVCIMCLEQNSADKSLQHRYQDCANIEIGGCGGRTVGIKQEVVKLIFVFKFDVLPCCKLLSTTCLMGGRIFKVIFASFTYIHVDMPTRKAAKNSDTATAGEDVSRTWVGLALRHAFACKGYSVRALGQFPADVFSGALLEVVALCVEQRTVPSHKWGTVFLW